MAKKQNDFRPDPKGPGLLSRMYIPRSQRLQILKWFLYSLTALVLMAIQDVIFSRMHLLGATVDLVPAVLLMVCVLQGTVAGGTFVLCGSLVYLLSGTAPVQGVMVLLTVLGIAVTLFRENFLRKGLSSAVLCAGSALMVYEMTVFFWGLVTGLTRFSRIGVFVFTGLLTLAVLPVLYPLLKLIGKIGGDTWKE